MKNTKFFNVVVMTVSALAISLGLAVTGCSGVNTPELKLGGAGKVLTSSVSAAGTSVGMPISAIAAWLGSQSANTPATPYTVPIDSTVVINSGTNWADINAAVASSEAKGRYAIIDVSLCSATGNTITGSTSLSGNAFNIINGNDLIVGVVLPTSLTSIGTYAFYGCDELTSVTIGNSVVSIGYQAFSDCTGLTAISLPGSLTTIGGYAFQNCTGLTGISIPANVTAIGSYAFQNCTGFTSITIPNGVVSIGNSAFSGCTNLAAITIAASVVSIGQQAFDGTAWYNAQSNGVVYAGNVLYTYKGAMPANTSIAVAAGTKGIADYALNGAANLVNITFPTGLANIGNFAFQGCMGIAGSLTLPSGLVSIGNSAFYKCLGLTGSLIILGTVTSIGSAAFYGCSGFTGTVTLPSGVTSISSSAFYGCSGITGIAMLGNVSSIGSNAFLVPALYAWSFLIPF